MVFSGDKRRLERRDIWGQVFRSYPLVVPKPGRERLEYYLALVGVDLLALGLAALLASLGRFYLGNLEAFSFLSLDSALNNLKLYWWTFIPIPLALAYRRTYDRRLPFWEETKEIMAALFLGFIFVFALISMGKVFQISRIQIGLFFVFSMVAVPLGRYLIKRCLFCFALFRRKVLILGAGHLGATLAQGLDRERYLGYEVVGFLDDDSRKWGRKIASKKVYGPIERAGRFVRFLGVDSVFIAMPSFSPHRISEIFAYLQSLVKEVSVVPELRDIGMLNAELSCLFNQKLLLIKIQNNLKSPVNQILKRCFDLLLAFCLLPAFLPIMALISFLIVLDSRGGPLFSQERLGHNGRRFRIYKFRTMYKNADALLEDYLKENPEARREWIQYRKLRHGDPRVTRVGRFLRKTSLDELPQIINVLKGQMSLVGPRPYLPEEQEDMNGFENIILLTRPGITGLWQVSGRNNLTFQDRLKMDVWYVLNWSLWLDLTILIRTIRAVLKREGSC
ncbi:undecaprenyl-phosphate galactose phosphotransferase WbaP [Thermosulfuriphilus sp.]